MCDSVHSSLRITVSDDVLHGAIMTTGENK